jgi:hypothetical protein
VVTEQYQTRHGFRELAFLESREPGPGGSATGNPIAPTPRSAPSLQTAR